MVSCRLSRPHDVIEGGMSTEATLAQVLVSKYADHLPLCIARLRSTKVRDQTSSVALRQASGLVKCLSMCR